MTLTVIGNPAKANARYYSVLDTVKLDYRNVNSRRAHTNELARVHEPKYVDLVMDGYSEEWVGRRPDLAVRAAETVGSTLTAARIIDQEKARKVFVPNGGRLHASASSSDRGSVFNDAVASARWLSRRGHDVTIIDIDGLRCPATEKMIGDDEAISLVSISEETSYLGPAEGSCYGFNLPEGSGDWELMDAVDAAIAVVDNLLPSVIILNVGVTGHESDELTDLHYTIDGIHEAVLRISRAADRISASRVIGLGGSASAGNNWAALIWAAASYALNQPYSASSARTRLPAGITNASADH